jgi:hypothetical protein
MREAEERLPEIGGPGVGWDGEWHAGWGRQTWGAGEESVGCLDLGIA